MRVSIVERVLPVLFLTKMRSSIYPLMEFFRLRSLLSINILTEFRRDIQRKDDDDVIFSDKLHSIVLIEFVENEKSSDIP